MPDSPAPSPHRPALARRILSVLGVLLAVLLAVWTIARVGDKAAMLAAFGEALARPGWLLLGIVLLGVSLAAGTVRWWLLLRDFKTPLPFRETLRLYLAGHFCSLFATGATGGDVVKAAVVVARFPGRRLAAVASIGVERVIGLLSLFIPLGLSVLFFRSRPDLMRLCMTLFFALFAAWCLTAVLLCLNWHWIARRMQLQRRFPSLCRRLAPLAAVWEDICRVCGGLGPRPRSHFRPVLRLSVLNHVVAALCGVAMARAAGVEVPLGEAFAAMLLSNAVAMVPLTPGGVGLREATTATLLQQVGATDAQAAATGFLVFGAILFWAAVGGVCWVALKERTPKKSRTSARSKKQT